MKKNNFKGNSIFQNEFFTYRIFTFYFTLLYSYTSNFLVSCMKKKYIYNNNSIKIIEK